jgi:sugar lactone lactonase YvrE
MADNAVHRVDPATGAVTPVVKGKIAAIADLAIAHDGDTTLHVTDIFAYRNADTKTGAVSTKLRMFGDEIDYPSGVGVGPKHVVLASLSSSTVQLVDRKTGKSKALWHGFKVPADAAETADGRILVLELGSGSLISVDDAKGKKKTTIASGFKAPVAMAIDDKKGVAYVTSSEGTVTRVDLKTGAKTVVAKDLQGPEGIDLAPDGCLVIAEVGAKRVITIHKDGHVETIASNLPIGLPAPEGQPPAFLPTGVAVDAAGDVYVAGDLTNEILKIGHKK